MFGFLAAAGFLNDSWSWSEYSKAGTYKVPDGYKAVIREDAHPCNLFIHKLVKEENSK